MKNECYHCGKGKLLGRQHTHHRGVAGGRWKKRAPKTLKVFSPNLQKVRIMVGAVAKQVNVCTKCLKRVRKDIIDKKVPFFKIVGSTDVKKAADLKKAVVPASK